MHRAKRGYTIKAAILLAAIALLLCACSDTSAENSETFNEMHGHLFDVEDEVRFEFAGTEGIMTTVEKQQVLDAVAASFKRFTDEDSAKQQELVNAPGGTYIDMTYRLDGKEMGLFYDATVKGHEYFVVAELNENDSLQRRHSVWADKSWIEPMEKLSAVLWERGDAERSAQPPGLGDVLFHKGEPVDLMLDREAVRMPEEAREAVYVAALSSADRPLTQQESKERKQLEPGADGIVAEMRYAVEEQVYVLEYNALVEGYETFAAYEYFQDEDLGFIAEVRLDSDGVKAMNALFGELLAE